MRFLLFSDLHLDAAFSWAGAKANLRREALRKTLHRIASLAREQDVDAVLCGGDLYEHEKVTPDTGEFLRDAFAELHPRRVYISPGNHDWFGPESLYALEDWPENVVIFQESTLSPVELSDGLTLWGAAHRTPANTGNFLRNFRTDRAGLNLALFHGSEESWSLMNTEQPTHAPFSVDDILRSKIDHVLLGHFHKPCDGEHHTYPGNPEPLSFGEDGERGAVVFEVQGDGKLVGVRHRVAVTDLHEISLDISGASSSQDVRERVEQALQGLTGIARVNLSGEIAPSTDLHSVNRAELNTSLTFPPAIRWTSVRLAYDFGSIAEEQTVRGEFVRSVRNSNHPDEMQHHMLVTGLRALEGREDLELL